MTEGPYKLPEGWRWVRLGEMCEILQGKTPPKSAYTSEPTKTKVLKFRDVTTNGDINWDNKERGFVHEDDKWRYARVGDVLVTASAHTPDQIGKKIVVVDHIPSEYSGVAVTGELMIFRALAHLLDNRWLRYWLASADGYKLLQTQVKEKHLVQSRARNILIPLPPLAEQRRIVARIEELMSRVREARRLRQEAREDAERLWQSVLSETFPQPGSDLPKGWRWVRLGEVAKAVNGFGFPKRFQGRRSGPIAFVKVSDLNSTANDPEVTVAANYIDEGILDTLKARAFKPGTIIFPKIGGAIATNKKRKLGVLATFDNNIMGLVPNSENILTDYLLQFMYTVDLSELSKTGPVPSIRQSVVEELQIPLPRLAEQRRIVTNLEAVYKRIKALKEAQAANEGELKRLEQAILEKAFRGEL